jgi:hypothetical protein
MTTTTTRTTRQSADTDAGVLAAMYSAAASDCLAPGKPTSHDAATIAYALLYLGSVIEAGNTQRRDDTDTLGALLDDKLGDIVVAIANRPPWWRRLFGWQPPVPDAVDPELNNRYDEIRKAAALSYDRDDRW